MILLLGGTSESIPIARALKEEGLKTILSTATSFPLNGEGDIDIERLSGRLDQSGLKNLIKSRNISAVIDATHPYASEISFNAAMVCAEISIPIKVFERRSDIQDIPGLIWAKDHNESAEIAVSFKETILLTTGTKNLKIYLEKAKEVNLRAVARILDNFESRKEALMAGLNDEDIIRTPSNASYFDNHMAIVKSGASVLVTKDSGAAGGTRLKVAAALEADCKVIVVERPKREGEKFDSFAPLIESIKASLKSTE